MRRREYLGLLGASTLSFVAGCNSGGSQTTTERPVITATTADTVESNPTTKRTTTNPTTTTQQASIQISDVGYVMSNSVTTYQDNQIPWAWVDVDNTTQTPYGYAQLEIRFRDADDNLLESRNAGYTDYIPPKTTWRYYQRYYTETPEKVDSVEARIVQNQPEVRGTAIDGELLNSNMDVDPEGGVDFDAEVDVGDSEADRIEAIVLFYDGAGRLRGSIRDVNINPAQSVAISARVLARTPPKLEDEQITRFEILLFEGYVY